MACTPQLSSSPFSGAKKSRQPPGGRWNVSDHLIHYPTACSNAPITGPTLRTAFHSFTPFIPDAFERVQDACGLRMLFIDVMNFWTRIYTNTWDMMIRAKCGPRTETLNGIYTQHAWLRLVREECAIWEAIRKADPFTHSPPTRLIAAIVPLLVKGICEQEDSFSSFHDGSNFSSWDTGRRKQHWPLSTGLKTL